MKRAWIIAVVGLALALPALGQIHGVPASVTSYGPGRGATPGPPASVTSLGPRGYAGSPPVNFLSPCSTAGPLIPSALGCAPAQFNTGRFFRGARDHGRRHAGSRHGGFVPLYVPYAYPYAYPVVVGAEPEQAAVAEPERPAPTIFENRPSAAARQRAPLPPPDGEEPQAEAEPAATPSPAEAREQIPVVLVYRDGHEQEVKNYAIVGTMLYDLGSFRAHKIPLAELDLKATVKANDDRGVEFAIPASTKLD